MALQDYKLRDDFIAVLSQLSALFIDDKNNHVLLRDFYQFIRPYHKKQFHEACSSLTGEGCGYKPEHGLPWEEQDLTTPSIEYTAAEAPRRGTEEPSTSTAHQQEVLETRYLKDMKMALDKYSYRRVYDALRVYKQTDEYQALEWVLTVLAVEKPRYMRVLQRAHMLVRPHHKDAFTEICMSLPHVGHDEKERQKIRWTWDRWQTENYLAARRNKYIQGTSGGTWRNTSSSYNWKRHRKSHKGDASGTRSPANYPDPFHDPEYWELDDEGYFCSNCLRTSNSPLECPTCSFNCCENCWDRFFQLARRCPWCCFFLRKRKLVLP